jgi:high-affinity iron transporter
MEAAFLIAFREGLEAFLILGLILAFLTKSGLDKFKGWAWSGAILGIAASISLAILFTIFIDGFESEEIQYIISLVVLIVAIVLLTYMVFWMQHNAHVSNMREKITLSTNQKWMIFFIVFTAILREGLETVLFMFALDIEESTELLFGLVGGLVLSAGIIWLVLKSSKNLPLKPFFKYSSYLILLIVAGLVSMFVKGLQMAEYIPIFIKPLYDSSAMISNDSAVGKVLGVLMGYDATPSLLQVIVWFGYIGFISLLLWRKKDV